MLGTGYQHQPTAFSPSLSDFHFQSTIITMRTSTIVAFIYLVMGVAPSFSLPSISVRSSPSTGSDDRRRGRRLSRTSQNDFYGHYEDSTNPNRSMSYPLHRGPPPDPNMVLVGTGREPRVPVLHRPNQSHQNGNHQNGNHQNGNHQNGNPPNTSRDSTPTPSSEQRKANYALNAGAEERRTLPPDDFARALRDGYNLTSDDIPR
ncbi:hypothetical protein F5148DRAFT_1368575 [Russula earlei]|uniref:Uncharacterized protein n=1 Tax=Russula earlei TaxID=71964 RepID=A0ACC0U7T1_9AGAM|nr:hypothetical protein F5148DRAFT_1368575 [Russula earlei]